MESIVSRLGVGSGIDTAALITSLVDADRQARSTPLTRKSETLAAQISALGQVKSSLQGIASSLAGRVSSGVLGLQVASSDAETASIERRGSGPFNPLLSRLSITAIANGQRLIAAPLANADEPVGEGTLTFSFGRRTPLAPGGFSFSLGAEPSLDITITSANNSLNGLADAINRARGPITASVINGVGGATLALRGQDGADYAFVASAAENIAAPGLARFAYTPGDPQLTLDSAAADAELVLDGVSVKRPTNVIDDLVIGTRLQLKKPGNVNVAAARDASSLATTVSDFAATLTAMRALIADFRRGASGDAAAGVLINDATARSVDLRISNLLAAPQAAANGLRLRDLGISADRSGIISFDPARLAALPANRQADAESLLRTLSAPASAQPQGLQAIAELVTPASAALSRRRTSTATDLTKVEARLTTYRDTLTRQYAAMDALVAASKAVGTQLDQQIKIWTNGRN